MRAIKAKYTERYRGCDILIYGTNREWLWQVVIYAKITRSTAYYFSKESAIRNAIKYIDKKVQ